MRSRAPRSILHVRWTRPIGWRRCWTGCSPRASGWVNPSARGSGWRGGPALDKGVGPPRVHVWTLFGRGHSTWSVRNRTPNEGEGSRGKARSAAPPNPNPEGETADHTGPPINPPAHHPRPRQGTTDPTTDRPGPSNPPTKPAITTDPTTHRPRRGGAARPETRGAGREGRSPGLLPSRPAPRALGLAAPPRRGRWVVGSVVIAGSVVGGPGRSVVGRSCPLRFGVVCRWVGRWSGAVGGLTLGVWVGGAALRAFPDSPPPVRCPVTDTPGRLSTAEQCPNVDTGWTGPRTGEPTHPANQNPYRRGSPTRMPSVSIRSSNAANR